MLCRVGQSGRRCGKDDHQNSRHEKQLPQRNFNEDSIIEFEQLSLPLPSSSKPRNKKCKYNKSFSTFTSPPTKRNPLSLSFFDRDCRSGGSDDTPMDGASVSKSASYPGPGEHSPKTKNSSSSVLSKATSRRKSEGPAALRWFSRRRPFFSAPPVPPTSSSPAPSTLAKLKKTAETTMRSKDDTQSLDVWKEISSSSTSIEEEVAFVPTLSDGSGQLLGATGAASSSRECPLCWSECSLDMFCLLRNCPHLFCNDCMRFYVQIEIQEGRVNVRCPQCTETLHPNDIEYLIGDKNSNLFTLYESLMLRRLLSTDPDTRWCPGPNCTFAVIAAGCAPCPKILCEKPGCGYSFCYHCKAEWHPNQTCDAARVQRQSGATPKPLRFTMPLRAPQSTAFSSLESAAVAAANVVSGGALPSIQQQMSQVKVCPRCNTLIVKMDDGSCNHMTCTLCGTEFCWLCMKEISDLHYLSPSGCTFWGKKPWSRKKKLFWQLVTLVGAPFGIAMLAGIAVPAMVIGIPCWVGRKVHNRLKNANKHKHNLAVVGGTVSSMIISPLLAGLAVSIGVPVLLCYVYGIVPIALCRSEGCGVYTSVSGVKIVDADERYEAVDGGSAAATALSSQQADVHLHGEDAISCQQPSVTDVANVGSPCMVGGGGRDALLNPSIGEVSLEPSLSLGSGCLLERENCPREADRESASNTAMAGASIAGSLASSFVGGAKVEVMEGHRKKCNEKSETTSVGISSHLQQQHRPEIGNDVHISRKKLSFSSERLSETVSLSEKSATISFAEDGAGSAISTRGLAGSILAYKMGDSQSVGSYRMCPSGETSETVSGVVTISAGTDFDQLSMKSLPLSSFKPPSDVVHSVPRNLGPVSFLSSAAPYGAARLNGSKRISIKCPQRSMLEKQLSEGNCRCEGSTVSEHVRFDEHISFIAAATEESPRQSPRKLKSPVPKFDWVYGEDGVITITTTATGSSIVSMKSNEGEGTGYLEVKSLKPVTDHVTLLNVGVSDDACSTSFPRVQSFNTKVPDDI